MKKKRIQAVVGGFLTMAMAGCEMGKISGDGAQAFGDLASIPGLGQQFGLPVPPEVAQILLVMSVVASYQASQSQRQQVERKAPAVKRAASRTDKRYVAVKTKSEKPKPKPKKAGNKVETVMIYDKKKGKYLDKAYDIEVPPKSQRKSDVVKIGPGKSADFPDI